MSSPVEAASRLQQEDQPRQDKSPEVCSRKSGFKAWLGRTEAAAIFVGSCLIAAYVVKERAYVSVQFAHFGPWGYPIAIVLLAIVASAPFSVTDALAIMNGAIFGPVGGSIVNALGILAAGVVGYLVARRTCALLEIDRRVEKLPPWVKRYKVGSFPFLVAVRVIPGIGGTIATQVAAAMRVPLYIHVGAMAAIAIPICTVLAIGGDSLAVFVDHRFTQPVGRYMRAHSHQLERMHLALPLTRHTSAEGKAP